MLRLGQESGLVAFDKEGKIPPAFLHDGMGGSHLGVQSVHQGDGPVQLQAAQQGLGGGNLVALIAHGFDAQGAPALRIDGPDQLGALAASPGRQPLLFLLETLALTREAALLLFPSRQPPFSRTFAFTSPWPMPRAVLASLWGGCE